MSNIKIEIQNFVSIFHGLCIFSFKCDENQPFTYENLLNHGKKILKEELVEFKALEKHLNDILIEYENHIKFLSNYSLSSNSQNLEVIFQNIFKNTSNDSGSFPYANKNKNSYYFPIKNHEPLTLTKYEKTLQLNKQSLHSLYKDFIKELNLLKNIQDLKSLSATFYFLFYKYSIHIPCFIKGLEDVSLFDFIRVIAAFNNCKFYENTSKEKPFLMVKGDITGIQNYIYSDITLHESGSGEGLTKKIRGRSFYISLLTDFIAKTFIESFQLPESNIIYSGGGHFLVLLPNIGNINAILDELEKKINLMLSQKIGLKLSFIHGRTELDETFLENASTAILNVNYSLNKTKQQKFLTYIDEIFNLKFCNGFNDEELGKLIPRGKYFIEVTLKEKETKIDNENGFAADFCEFHTYYFILEKENELNDLLNKHIQNIEKVKVYCLNDVNFIEPFKNLMVKYPFSIAMGYKIIASYVPKENNNKPYEFEGISKLDLDLDKTKGQELSFSQLGILRLDVDNLGALFAFGLEENGKTSLMRVATLSRELHQYFSGYSNTLCEKYRIYTVYSGGDDAFFIGSWINILHFAKEFRDNFREFTCENPNFTFSAGIFMCDHHHPIGKFAEQAAEMEELSKKFKNGRKNALTVFDHTLSWESYNEMLNFSRTLLKFVDDKHSNEKNTEKFARSFIHRILRMIKSSLHTKGPHKGEVDVVAMYKNSVQLKYLLARKGFDAEEIKSIQKDIVKEIVKVIIDNFDKKDLIKNYIIPMSYVILKTRVVKKS